MTLVCKIIHRDSSERFSTVVEWERKKWHNIKEKKGSAQWSKGFMKFCLGKNFRNGAFLHDHAYWAHGCEKVRMKLRVGSGSCELRKLRCGARICYVREKSIWGWPKGYSDCRSLATSKRSSLPRCNEDTIKKLSRSKTLQNNSCQNPI